MDKSRLNRDYSKGPVWDGRTRRWLVEIRYPDDTRFRKRFKRERDAHLVWGVENGKIERGTWDEQRKARNITVGDAMARYREFSKAQHRSYRGATRSALGRWEKVLGAQTRLARVTSQRIEAYKLERVESVTRTTVDRDLGVLKAFFNWCIRHDLAAWNPVRRVKLFHENVSRLRYLTREEYDRLIAAARTLAARPLVSTPSPYLEEKIVLATHTGLRRGNLFDLSWDQIDLINGVLRIPRTKSGHPLSVPLNETARTTLERLFAAREPKSDYVFPHKVGPNAGKPVHDIKNGWKAALKMARIEDFTWHDLRHTFASWLMMRGASLRSIADLLGHQSMKMTMRYAHLSPDFLTREVRLLDEPAPARATANLPAVSPALAPPATQTTTSTPTSSAAEVVANKELPADAPTAKRARKGQSGVESDQLAEEARNFAKENGSPHWTISATG